MTATTVASDHFLEELVRYRSAIEQDIAVYTKYLQRDSLQRYGSRARLAVDEYLNILSRGGKRIRGTLVMAGYEASGGTDFRMITHAARAVEMIHAYILIIDDIQDRSATRRGGATAHTALSAYHKEHELAGESAHFGVSVALNAALIGNHAAQNVLGHLTVDSDIKLAAIQAVNETMITTSHGQTNDIFNEVVADISSQDIERVLEWKTAHYTFLNPLRVGMVLAGIDEHKIAALEPYALHAGKAFQITDDILGTFGSEFESGKSPMDDIREGKRTIITEYALTHCNDENKNFLIRMLGNTHLSPIEFERCKAILIESGALAYAEHVAAQHVAQAKGLLGDQADCLSEEGIMFLTGLADFLLNRTA